MQIFISGCGNSTFTLSINPNDTILSLKEQIQDYYGIPSTLQTLMHHGKLLSNIQFINQTEIEDSHTLYCSIPIKGGIDFQNRAGSKPGSGGVASQSQANIDRRERLRKLALETVDLAKDPYFMKNHLGSYECKLCLTLHNNEGNYLAHTQGKRHQTNLARRAAKEAAEAPSTLQTNQAIAPRRTIKIGRPGYKVTKQRNPATDARSLLFEIHYPAHQVNLQPRHRFMSCYEQKQEMPDKNFQYLLFACEPYETIGFKIPNQEVDKTEGHFFSNWDKQGKIFTLQITFLPESEQAKTKPLPPPPRPKLRYH